MKKDIETMHNQVVEEVSKIFNENIEEVAQKAIDNASNLEILPINTYVLVKPYSTNPYSKINVTETGLAMNTAEPKLFNKDSGEEETPEMWEQVASVVEVSPSCKYVKVGDDIFYRKLQAVPVAFLGLGLEVVSENQILAIVNDNLKKRFGI